LFIPQAIILYFAATPLIWIDQPEVSANYAQDYTRWFLPGIIALTHIELISRFLASQGVFYLVLKVQVAAMFYHLAVCYILTHVFDYQLVGIALANSITHISTLIFLVFYITFSKDVVKKDSWHFINADSFKGIGEYLRYGLPSMFMTVLEFWCFEMLIVMSGYLGTDEQGASIIIINFLTLLYMVPFGMSFATTNLVGSNLGAGKPLKAKRYAIISITVTCIMALVTITFMMLTREQIARIFTDHENVANLISNVFPVVALFTFSDFVQGTAGGTIRAMGYQKYATFFCLFNYW
jgi:MATE family multidrug resistance protein